MKGYEGKETMSDSAITQETLFSRIAKEFPNATFIGDIRINEREYEMLIYYARIVYRQRKNGRNPERINSDIFFAVALVQIGVRYYYDGKYWEHVARALTLRSLSGSDQKWIRDAFFQILEKYGKPIGAENRRIENSILMHGVVSDYYAPNLFRFLYFYYRIDLLRNLENNTDEMFALLLEIMRRNDGKNRTNLLVAQTQSALIQFPNECADKIKQLLEWMDSGFHDNLYIKPQNRLHRLLNEWMQNGDEFQSEIKRTPDRTRAPLEKRFSTPTLRFHFAEDKCELTLPQQMVKDVQGDELVWAIIVGEKTITESVSLLEEGVTGLSTEAHSFILPIDYWFNAISVSLQDASREEIVKEFTIPQEEIRFFDKQGFHKKPENLPEGEVYGVGRISSCLNCDATMDIRRFSRYKRFDLNLKNGDIAYFADGRSFIVGGSFIEGFSRKGLIADAHALINAEKAPIFNSPPTLRFRIHPDKFPGSALIINQTRNRLKEDQTIKFQLHDGGEEMGYQIALADYLSPVAGYYEIILDVPNDRAYRGFRFAYLPDFSFAFQEAPYIFNEMGIVGFNAECSVTATQPKVEKKEQWYSFPIDENHLELSFQVAVGEAKIPIKIATPCFQYQFDHDIWQTQPPRVLTLKNMPKIINMKFPEETLHLFIGENNNQATMLQKNSAGIFEYDTTRLRNWFHSASDIDEVKVYIAGAQTNSKGLFFPLQIRSQVVEHQINADFERGKIQGFFRIDGSSTYSADILFRGETLAENIPLLNKRFEIDSNLAMGIYTVIIYEEEEDETGFAISNRVRLKSFDMKLIDPNDLSGRTINILWIEKKNEGEGGKAHIRKLRKIYKIRNLEKKDLSEKNVYYGNIDNENMAVRIRFPEDKFSNKVKINCWIDLDGIYGDFLYYDEKLWIVDPDVTFTIAYIKYLHISVLDEDECDFIVEIE